MCKTKEYLDIIFDIVDKSKRDLKDLYKELSTVDKELENIYHELEIMKFNASQGYKIIIYIQKLRKKRREIKNDIINLELLTQGKMEGAVESVKHKLQKHIELQDKLIINTGVIDKIIS
jgi:hypothetical protein